MPSIKPKPQEKKDRKNKKVFWDGCPIPAASKGASSSLEQPRLGNPSTTSSSPGGRDSIFETPSTKHRTKIGAMSSAVEGATYTRSSDGGRSFNETPPTSDPIDVDISSDEDIPSREVKSVCHTHIRAYTLIVSGFCAPRLVENERWPSKIQTKEKEAKVVLLAKMAHQHTSVLRNPVRTTAATRPSRRFLQILTSKFPQGKRRRLAWLLWKMTHSWKVMFKMDLYLPFLSL
jgi:hypothetical protein